MPNQRLYEGLQVKIISEFNHLLETRVDNKILSLGVKNINETLKAYNNEYTFHRLKNSTQLKPFLILKNKFVEVRELFKLNNFIEELLVHPEYFNVNHLQKQAGPPQRGGMALISFLSKDGQICFSRFFALSDFNNYNLSQFFLKLNSIAKEQEHEKRIAFLKQEEDLLARNILSSYRGIAEDPLICEELYI